MQIVQPEVVKSRLLFKKAWTGFFLATLWTDSPVNINIPPGDLNWPGFWTTVKDYSFDYDQVHEEARRLFSFLELKSLREILKTPEEMNEFLEYLRGR